MDVSLVIDKSERPLERSWRLWWRPTEPWPLLNNWTVRRQFLGRRPLRTGATQTGSWLIQLVHRRGHLRLWLFQKCEIWTRRMSDVHDELMRWEPQLLAFSLLQPSHSALGRSYEIKPTNPPSDWGKIQQIPLLVGQFWPRISFIWLRIFHRRDIKWPLTKEENLPFQKKGRDIPAARGPPRWARHRPKATDSGTCVNNHPPVERQPATRHVADAQRDARDAEHSIWNCNLQGNGHLPDVAHGRPSARSGGSRETRAESSFSVRSHMQIYANDPKHVAGQKCVFSDSFSKQHNVPFDERT